MLKKFIIEGLKSVKRSIWLTITAVTVLTVSLASVALVISLSVGVGYVVRNLDALVSFPVFFKENVKEEVITAEVIPKLQSNQNIKTVEYFDREAARAKLEEGSVGFVSSFLSRDENYAWRYVLITPTRSEYYGEVVEFTQNLEYNETFEAVQADQGFIDRLLNFYSWINLTTFVLIVVFSIVSILVMSNILRMTIYNNRDQIEIMRLVGATNNYIRGPFVVQGVFYSLISAIAVFVFFSFAVSFIAPYIINFVNFSDGSSSTGMLTQIYLSLLITVVSGIALGAATVYVSIQRYLKI